MPTDVSWREVVNDWCDRSTDAAPDGTPRPLADFWAAGGAAALSRQNRFQSPADEDGYSVFYVENQGVCAWAYRSDDAAPDPEVHVRDCHAADAHWAPVGCRLDAFLSAAAVIEIVLGAPFGRAAEGPTDDTDRILGLDRVRLPELGWPPGVRTSYYTGPDLLAFAQAEEGYSFAFVGARNPDALRDMDQRIDASPSWQRG
jgi:hypothetical protein